MVIRAPLQNMSNKVPPTRRSKLQRKAGDRVLFLPTGSDSLLRSNQKYPYRRVKEAFLGAMKESGTVLDDTPAKRHFPQSINEGKLKAGECLYYEILWCKSSKHKPGGRSGTFKRTTTNHSDITNPGKQVPPSTDYLKHVRVVDIDQHTMHNNASFSQEQLAMIRTLTRRQTAGDKKSVEHRFWEDLSYNKWRGTAAHACLDWARQILITSLKHPLDYTPGEVQSQKRYKVRQAHAQHRGIRAPAGLKCLHRAPFTSLASWALRMGLNK